MIDINNYSIKKIIAGILIIIMIYIGIVNTIRYISNTVKNQTFKSDLNRIEALCLYGLENRDIIALIDARRIMRDIQYHMFEVPYFIEGDAIVKINEEDYSIYYGQVKY